MPPTAPVPHRSSPVLSAPVQPPSAPVPLQLPLPSARILLLRSSSDHIRLETRRNGRVALVSLAGLAKAVPVRHLGMQRGGGRRDPKLAG